MARTVPTDQSQAYVFLFMAIYLFSNKLLRPGLYLPPEYRPRNLFATLDAVFEVVPQGVLEHLLRSRLSILKGAREQLLLVAGHCKQARFFRILAEVGLADGWVNERQHGQECLWFAASMGLIGVVGRLLEKGCRPDERLTFRTWAGLTHIVNPTAVLEAIKNGHFECAQLLLQHCDVNAPLLLPGSRSSKKYDATTFQEFARHHASADERSQWKEGWMRGLRMLLEAGANLDALFTWSPRRDYIWDTDPERWDSGYWIGQQQPDVLTSHCFRRILQSRPGHHRTRWWPSILDYFFYFDRPVFNHFSHYSQAFTRKVTRSGVLQALERGNLDQYLDSKQSSIYDHDIRNLLQTILAEQFFIREYETPNKLPSEHAPAKKPYLEVVRALLDLGIDFDHTSTLEVPRGYDIYRPRIQLGNERERTYCNQVTFLLYAILCDTLRTEPQLEAMQVLIGRGADVTCSHLVQASRYPGTGLLKLVLSHVEGIATEGARALAVSASRNNFEAVELLLDAGVDVNTELVDRRGKPGSIVAFVLENWDGCQQDPSQMVRFLVSRGAILRVSREKPLLSDLLRFPLTYRYVIRLPSILQTACFAIDQGLESGDPDILSASMLECCGCPPHLNRCDDSLEMFEYLFWKGASLGPGSPLAAWIYTGGGIGLVQEMLDRGADKNSHSAQNLLFGGRLTPLQAAAAVCNEEVVLLLLREGADVNAPAKGRPGTTALQAICSFNVNSQDEQERKTRIVQTLIAHDANVNAGLADQIGATALQHAAADGDLPLAVLLLRHGADVNAPPFKKMKCNALDRAAGTGRLDMVKLLLNANALSHLRGMTGYDGAIKRAEKHKHFVVADLIRQHAAETASNEELINPYLQQPPRDWREYRYGSDSDSYSDSEDASWDSDSDSSQSWFLSLESESNQSDRSEDMYSADD